MKVEGYSYKHIRILRAACAWLMTRNNKIRTANPARIKSHRSNLPRLLAHLQLFAGATAHNRQRPTSLGLLHDYFCTRPFQLINSRQVFFCTSPHSKRNNVRLTQDRVCSPRCGSPPSSRSTVGLNQLCRRCPTCTAPLVPCCKICAAIALRWVFASMQARLRLPNSANQPLTTCLMCRAAPARAYGEESKYFDLNVRSIP